MTYNRPLLLIAVALVAACSAQPVNPTVEKEAPARAPTFEIPATAVAIAEEPAPDPAPEIMVLVVHLRRLRDTTKLPLIHFPELADKPVGIRWQAQAETYDKVALLLERYSASLERHREAAAIIALADVVSAKD